MTAEELAPDRGNLAGDATGAADAHSRFPRRMASALAPDDCDLELGKIRNAGFESLRFP